MSKGNAVGFTDIVRERCRNACAEFGEPPCWQLPDLTSDCDDQTITPCSECQGSD